MNKDIKIYETPEFNRTTGYLKSGIHLMTISELFAHPILGGTEERQKLIKSLESACNVYRKFNITEIYTNGSFSTMKEIPRDIDGYICFDPGDDSRLIQLEESGSVWGNFKGKNHPKDKYPMWYEHKIEFYPQIGATGRFYKLFSKSRDGINRGIIKIVE